MDRRKFLAGTAVAASTLSAVNQAYAAPRIEKRRVGLIGCGWYGKCDLLQLLNVEPVEVVSLCDVDSRMLQECADLIQSRQPSKQRPRTYADYTELLAEKDLDIVLVDTPDHWHALPMIAAVESGADVYVQKPTGVDVLESKAMLDAARRTGRVVQVGTQRRSTPHLIDAKKQVVEAGLLGDIAHAEICCYYHMRARKNPPNSTPPAHFDYEAWTGPAPMRPYNELVHPRSWRAFMEYGNGIVGDMCVHMLDLVRWQLDLGWPKRISSSGGILVDPNSIANITDTQTACYEFDDLNVTWAHRSWGSAPDPEWPWAATIYGDKGTLKLDVHKWEFTPTRGGKKLTGTKVIETDQFPTDLSDVKDWRLELHVASAIRGHMKDFLSAIDNRSKPIADIEQGHISSASCILANKAMELGRTLEFDPDTHTLVGDEEATDQLKRPYRKPYIHPSESVRSAHRKNMKLLPAVDAFVKDAIARIPSISPSRKSFLNEIASEISQRTKNELPIRLLFLCTHNSRRSHLGQVFCQLACEYYGHPNIETYSGGTEVTACHPHTVEAFGRAGFETQSDGQVTNPHYRLRYAEDRPPVVAFSKRFDESPNPSESIIAMVCCDHADKACPVIPGAEKRFPLHYSDPKIADGTDREAQTYDERAKEIATEMFAILKAC